MKEYEAVEYKGLWIVTESCSCGSHAIATCTNKENALMIVKALKDGGKKECNAVPN